MNRLFNILLIVGLVFLVLWLLGFITSYTLGGYIHLVLVVGLLCFVFWLGMYVMKRRR